MHSPRTYTSRRLWIMVAVLIAVEVVSSFESAMIFTALPTINREYKSIENVGWLITAFVLSQAATAAIGGRLGDMFGRKRLLIAVVALCAIGSTVSAITDSLPMIILGRVIQGASGVILPLCYGIMREISPQKRLPFFIGCLAGAYSVSAALGYVLGGILVDLGGWHMIFAFNAGYAFSALLPIYFFLPNTAGTIKIGRIDFAGLLFVPAITLVLFGITKAPEWGWQSQGVLLCIASGFVVLAAWCRHELRVSEPLIDVRLLARREVAIGNACIMIMAAGSSQLALVLLMILQQPAWTGVGLGVSATVAGLIKLPSNIAGGGASIVSGYIFGLRGPRQTVFLGAVVCALGYASIAFFHDQLWQVVSGSMIAVIGATILLAAAPNLVLRGAPENRSSEVTGISAVIRGIFMALGIQLVTTILASSSSTAAGASAFPSETAYMLTFAFMGGSALIIFLLGFLIPNENEGRHLAAAT